MALKTKRIRAGLYEITDPTGLLWYVDERRVHESYGGGWAWFALGEDGAALDPLPRLSDVKAALALETIGCGREVTT